MSKMFYTVTDEKNRNTQNMHLQFCQIQMYKEEIGVSLVCPRRPSSFSTMGCGVVLIL
jgi:hypothetical protein